METWSLKCYQETPFVYLCLQWIFVERKIWQNLVWPHCAEDGDLEVMIGYSLLCHWGRNRRHFADDIFKCIFLNENVWIALKISLKFVPKVWINNIPVYWRIYASLGLNELYDGTSLDQRFCQYQAGMPILEKKILLMQLTICMILIQNVSKWLLRMLHMPWQLCCWSMWKSLKWLDKPIGIELHKTWKSNCQWKIVDKMCLWISCGACGFFLNPVKSCFNSLRLSDVIWWQRSGSTLAQVMACGLTAPSHYLNQCWLIISKV